MSTRRPQNSRKRATVTSRTLVMIKITGYDQSEPGDTLPRILDDEDLVRDVRQWTFDQGIHAWHSPYVGGGQALAYYEPEDAEKVLAWLKEHNKR